MKQPLRIFFQQFQLQVSLGKFLNVKMSRFTYTGNTEAGCYLGGIIILPDGRPPIGPLCGEVGRLIFEDNRLNGLTLGAHTAEIIVFLFSGQNSNLLLDMRVSSDKCEGVTNFNFDTYIGKSVSFTSLHYEYNWILLSDIVMSPNGCVKLYYFSDSLVTNTDKINRAWRSGPILKHNYNVTITMVSKAVQCWSSWNHQYIRVLSKFW